MNRRTLVLLVLSLFVLSGAGAVGAYFMDWPVWVALLCIVAFIGSGAWMESSVRLFDVGDGLGELLTGDGYEFSDGTCEYCGDDCAQGMFTCSALCGALLVVEAVNNGNVKCRSAVSAELRPRWMVEPSEGSGSGARCGHGGGEVGSHGDGDRRFGNGSGRWPS